MKKFMLALLGLVTGIFNSGLGVGGGAILVPGFTLMFKYKMKKAVATSLVIISACALVGVLTHYILKSSNIIFYMVLLVLAGSIIGSKLGAYFASKINEVLLRKIFAVFVFIAGLKLAGILNFPTTSAYGNAFYILLILLGLIAGIASALLGIGSGAIMVPALTLFFGLTMHEAIATSLTIILPTSFFGAFFHNKYGHIVNEGLEWLIPFALLGAVLGAIFANLLPADVLRMFFGIFLLIISFRIYMK